MDDIISKSVTEGAMLLPLYKSSLQQLEVEGEEVSGGGCEGVSLGREGGENQLLNNAAECYIMLHI